MTWTRWWAALLLSTLAALVVSIAAGDFDGTKRERQRHADIEAARQRTGVDGQLPDKQEQRP